MQYSYLLPDDWTDISLNSETLPELAQRMAERTIAVAPHFKDMHAIYKKKFEAQLQRALDTGTSHIASFAKSSREGTVAAYMITQVIPQLIPEKGESEF
ncbi:hypothetical protein ACFQY8_00045 [Alloscardovia venturai]|uniref:Uncharacterized protein n=1 Tax=Alloscardovia venturai TaxID=1769421 RepID=A0ABW2Y3W6_9BIFI